MRLALPMRLRGAAVKAQIATPWRARRKPTVKGMLLAFESCLTTLPFIVSWLICAIAFSVKAGYLMAKADSADKAAILDKMWKRASPKDQP